MNENHESRLDRSSRPRHRPEREAVLTGECNHCKWFETADSYSEMVTLYQDHLRDEHPTAWLRS